MGTDESLYDLHCQQTVTPLEEEEEEEEAELNDDDGLIGLYNYINTTGGDQEEDEYLKMLLDREISIGFKKNNKSSVFDEWLKSARLEAINWILKCTAVFGIQRQTAYLSVTYFDRFLSRKSINQEQSRAMKLLSVACLSLAAKVVEPNPPFLSELQVEEYNFQSKIIKKMELLVLDTLEWRMNLVTPFGFLYYFFTRFCNGTPPTRHIVSRTVQLVLGLVKEINLMEHRPSVIAAAAILAVLDQRSTRQELMECKMHRISSCGFLEIEEVLECYNLMQKMELNKLEIPKSLNSPHCSPTQLRRLRSTLDDSSVSSAVNVQRKRFRFN